MCNRHTRKLFSSSSSPLPPPPPLVVSAVGDAVVCGPFDTLASRTYPLSNTRWPCTEVKVEGKVHFTTGHEGAEEEKE